MKKIIIIIISLSLIHIHAQAQDALTMQDLNFDKAAYNSAFIVQNTERFNASLTSSIGGGLQKTNQLNFMGYANVEESNFGVGLKVNSKSFGLFKTTTAELLYAKPLQINDQHSFYAGLNVGMHFAGIEMSRLTGSVDMTDPFLMENEFPQTRLTAGVGLAYTFENKLTIGVSSPSLLRSNSEFAPAYVANASYRYESIMAGISLTPQVMVYGSSSSPLTYEGSLMFGYKDALWFRVGGRSTGTINWGLGWQQNFIGVGYNYNMNTGDYSEINPGVHNLNVSFRVSKKAKTE